MRLVMTPATSRTYEPGTPTTDPPASPGVGAVRSTCRIAAGRENSRSSTPRRHRPLGDQLRRGRGHGRLDRAGGNARVRILCGPRAALVQPILRQRIADTAKGPHSGAQENGSRESLCWRDEPRTPARTGALGAAFRLIGPDLTRVRHHPCTGDRQRAAARAHQARGTRHPRLAPTGAAFRTHLNRMPVARPAVVGHTGAPL